MCNKVVHEKQVKIFHTENPGSTQAGTMRVVIIIHSKSDPPKAAWLLKDII
jgi:hypothetical protein